MGPSRRPQCKIPNMIASRRAGTFAALVVLLASCARSVPVRPRSAAGPCVLGSAMPAGDTLTVGFAARIDTASAPVPTSAAERFLFRQLYRTLVSVDCAGRVRPGVARSWSPSDGGRLWTFRLDTEARFSDGRPIDASAVRDAWLATTASAGAPWADSLARSVVAPEPGTLVVRLAFGLSSARIFADPRLAVWRPGEWRVASGAAGVERVAPDTIELAPEAVMHRDRVRVLRVMSGRRDLRDALDGEAALVITDQRTVLDYAARSGAYQAAVLPWDRLYVLIAPGRLGRVSETGAGGASLGADLVAGAVTVDARIAQGRYWWQTSQACPQVTSALTSFDIGREPRIAYPSEDAVAREIAQRLVALGRAGALASVIVTPDNSERLVAAPLDPPELAATLGAGTARGYVLPLPSAALDACSATRELWSRLSWIDPNDLASVMVPLVEVRSHALLRAGSGTWAIDWDGTPVFEPWEGRLP